MAGSNIDDLYWIGIRESDIKNKKKCKILQKQNAETKRIHTLLY